jgi:hypothetical protein
MRTHFLLLLWLLLAQASASAANESSALIDLGAASIFAPKDLNRREKKAVATLVEEIGARTRLHLTVVDAWPKDAKRPVIAVGPISA